MANCPVGVTCYPHLATATGVVRIGEQYIMVFNGSSPQTSRIHLQNAQPTDAILLIVRMNTPQRLQVRCPRPVSTLASQQLMMIAWYLLPWPQVFINEVFVPDVNYNGQEPIIWTNPSYVPVPPTLGTQSHPVDGCQMVLRQVVCGAVAFGA